MTTVAALERLAALNERLVPLADMRQGTLIRADDWNLLTGAVIELARVLLAESSGTIVAEHEHVEEVDVGWLTPKLRALIEQGGLSDPVVNRRLTTFERDNEKLKAQLALLQEELGKVRVNLNDVKISDIGRTADFTILRRKFEAQSDARDEVLDLRTTLGTIQENIDQALELGDRIRVNGELPNFDELFGRVSNLEQLRERLTNPDGTMLDARTLQIQLAELQSKFITQEQLDDALRDVRTRPPQDLIDQLTADLRTFTEAQLATAITQQRAELDQRYVQQDLLGQQLGILANELRSEQTTQFDTFRRELIQRFVAADELNQRLAEFANSQQTVISESISKQLDARMDELNATLEQRFVTSARLNNQLALFGDELTGQITKSVQGSIKEQVAIIFDEQASSRFISNEEFQKRMRDIQAQIDELRARPGGSLDDLSPRLDERFVSLEALNARLAPLEGRPETTPTEVFQQEVAAAVEAALGEFDRRLSALSEVEGRLNTMLSNQLAALRQEMSSVAQQAAATQLQGIQNSLSTLQGQVQALDSRINTRIRGEIDSSLREFTAAIQADLNTVKQSVGQLNRRLGSDVIVDPRIVEPRAVTQPVDFTQLRGVGEQFASRLHASGIQTFEQLAALSDEELARLLGTTLGRVRQLGLQAQAAARIRR
jgi:predicted flap endonuclease-1-like 5' DNA nuclease